MSEPINADSDPNDISLNGFELFTLVLCGTGYSLLFLISFWLWWTEKGRDKHITRIFVRLTVAACLLRSLYFSIPEKVFDQTFVPEKGSSTADESQAPGLLFGQITFDYSFWGNFIQLSLLRCIPNLLFLTMFLLILFHVAASFQMSFRMKKRHRTTKEKSQKEKDKEKENQKKREKEIAELEGHRSRSASSSFSRRPSTFPTTGNNSQIDEKITSGVNGNNTSASNSASSSASSASSRLTNSVSFDGSSATTTVGLQDVDFEDDADDFDIIDPSAAAGILFENSKSQSAVSSSNLGRGGSLSSLSQSVAIESPVAYRLFVYAVICSFIIEAILLSFCFVVDQYFVLALDCLYVSILSTFCALGMVNYAWTVWRTLRPLLLRSAPANNNNLGNSSSPAGNAEDTSIHMSPPGAAATAMKPARSSSTEWSRTWPMSGHSNSAAAAVSANRTRCEWMQTVWDFACCMPDRNAAEGPAAPPAGFDPTHNSHPSLFSLPAAAVGNGSSMANGNTNNSASSSLLTPSAAPASAPLFASSTVSTGNIAGGSSSARVTIATAQLSRKNSHKIQKISPVKVERAVALSQSPDDDDIAAASHLRALDSSSPSTNDASGHVVHNHHHSHSQSPYTPPPLGSSQGTIVDVEPERVYAHAKAARIVERRKKKGRAAGGGDDGRSDESEESDDDIDDHGYSYEDSVDHEHHLRDRDHDHDREHLVDAEDTSISISVEDARRPQLLAALRPQPSNSSRAYPVVINGKVVDPNQLRAALLQNDHLRNQSHSQQNLFHQNNQFPSAASAANASPSRGAANRPTVFNSFSASQSRLQSDSSSMVSVPISSSAASAASNAAGAISNAANSSPNTSPTAASGNVNGGATVASARRGGDLSRAETLDEDAWLLSKYAEQRLAKIKAVTGVILVCTCVRVSSLIYEAILSFQMVFQDGNTEFPSIWWLWLVVYYLGAEVLGTGAILYTLLKGDVGWKKNTQTQSASTGTGSAPPLSASSNSASTTVSAGVRSTPHSSLPPPSPRRGSEAYSEQGVATGVGRSNNSR